MRLRGLDGRAAHVVDDTSYTVVVGPEFPAT